MITYEDVWPRTPGEPCDLDSIAGEFNFSENGVRLLVPAHTQKHH